MTNEQRLDRIERIGKLFVRAGPRERRSRRELDEKIDIIINSQIANAGRFARTDAQIAALSESQKHTDTQIAALTESQKQTDRRLDTLIDIVIKGTNGNSN